MPNFGWWSPGLSCQRTKTDHTLLGVAPRCAGLRFLTFIERAVQHTENASPRGVVVGRSRAPLRGAELCVNRLTPVDLQGYTEMCVDTVQVIAHFTHVVIESINIEPIAFKRYKKTYFIKFDAVRMIKLMKSLSNQVY